MNQEIDIESQERLLTALVDFVLKRGWKLKIAKKEPLEQSLLIHSINELGAIQNYLRISSHPFNDSEIVKLYIASTIHDCEKETEEWQENVRIGEKTPHHTNPDYARRFIEGLLEFLRDSGINLDFNQADINDIISSQPLHMKAAAKNPNIVFDEMIKKHKSERWSEIAHLVGLFDNIVSVESVESAIVLLSKDEYKMLSERLEFTHHKIANMRGVLSSLLHKACENVHEKHGFKPFLYYVDGTLYFKERRYEQGTKITISEIKDSLKKVFNEFIHKIDDDNKVVIENPQTKLFRGREFFDKDLIDKYFFTLQRNYRPKVDKDKLKKSIVSQFNSIEKAKERLNIQEVKETELIDTIMQNIDTYSERFPKFVEEIQEIYNISISKPQQYLFQLFKEIIEELNIDKTVIADIEKDYDLFFGTGEYSHLKSLTNDPKKNFKSFIEPYWEMEIYFNNNKIKIKKLDIKRQGDFLSKTLCDILKKNIDKCSNLPKDDFVGEIVDLLISDLVYPHHIHIEDIKKYAQEQLKNIGKSKVKLFNKTRGERLCPVCYKIMPDTNPVTAAFISNEKGVAKVFNNQAAGASAFGGSVNICRLCYAELLLRRVILGRTPSDLVILFPSLNFAKIQGSKVMELMRDIQNKLEQFYSYHNPDLSVRPQLNNLRNVTTQILERSAEEISAELDPDKFIESFKIEISEETRKNDLKKLENKIKELDEFVEDFNKSFNTRYATFKEIAEDIFENRCIHKDTHQYENIPETERNQIIEDAEVNPIQYSLICETPNFIILSLPVTFSYNKDEAEVNLLLKRLLFASYLYLLTDCTVMVIPGKEIIHIPPARKMVYVQPNATLKKLIKDDWISLFELQKWMVAISAAVKLAYEGDYSSRSGIFEVLIQPTVGHIISRITSQKTQSGASKRADSRLINILDKLQNSGVLINEVINVNYFIQKENSRYGGNKNEATIDTKV